jgi:hypothetical protein
LLALLGSATIVVLSRLRVNVKRMARQLEGNLGNIAGGECSRSGSIHESFYKNLNITNNKKS